MLENRKVLDLSKTEMLALLELGKYNQRLSVKELVVKMKKDRTTIQKVVNKLLGNKKPEEKKFLQKKQINLDRGFMFVYFLNKDNNVFDLMENKLENTLKEFKEKRALLTNKVRLKDTKGNLKMVVDTSFDLNEIEFNKGNKK